MEDFTVSSWAGACWSRKRARCCAGWGWI